jgi:hypothetical protein
MPHSAMAVREQRSDHEVIFHRITFKDVDAYEIAVERYGVLDGGTQAVDRLAAYVDSIA